MDTDLNREINQLHLEASAEEAANTPPPVEEVAESNQITDEQLEEMLVGNIALLSGIGFNFIAPNWQVQPEENLLVGQEAAKVVSHYFPNAKDYAGPFTGLLMAIGGIAAPRIMEGRPMSLPDQEEADFQKSAATHYQGEESPQPITQPPTDNIPKMSEVD